jgi:hypothetical protein
VEEGGTKLEPIAAIGDPPTHNANGNGCRQRPPKWQNDISQQAQADESDPKDLSLHSLILARMYREEVALRKNHASCLRREEAPAEQAQPFRRNRERMGCPYVGLSAMGAPTASAGTSSGQRCKGMPKNAERFLASLGMT